MKIEVKQEKLARGLSITSKAAGGIRSGLPILNNILIKAQNGKVNLIATNLDMAIKSNLAVSAAIDGEVAVPAKLLAEFVGNLPKGEIIELSDNENKIEIKSGKYKSVINGALVKDFPELPEIDENNAVIFKMGVDDFKSSVSSVIIASSNDTNRPVLTGIYFNTYNNDLYIAATDGYRMAEKKFVSDIKSEVKAVVPSSSLQEVMRSINEDVEEIEILFDNEQVKFRFGDVELISRLIDGSFPDYRQIFPKEINNGGLVELGELMRVARLSALFTRNLGGSIVCESKKEEGLIVVSSINNEIGSNSSEINAEIFNDGKTVINTKYLIDVLGIIESSKVRFGIPEKGSKIPVLIMDEKNEDYRHIIMPIEGK